MMRRYGIILWGCGLAAADRMDPGWVEPGWRCAAHDRAAPCLDLTTCRRGAARRKAIVSVFDAHGDTSATLQGFVKHRERLAKRARSDCSDGMLSLTTEII